MPDWIVAAVVFTIPLIALAGAAQWRLGRNEKDLDALKNARESDKLAADAQALEIASMKGTKQELTSHELRDTAFHEELKLMLKEQRLELLSAVAEVRSDIRALRLEDTGAHAREAAAAAAAAGRPRPRSGG